MGNIQSAAVRAGILSYPPAEQLGCSRRVYDVDREIKKRKGVIEGFRYLDATSQLSHACLRVCVFRHTLPAASDAEHRLLFQTSTSHDMAV